MQPGPFYATNLAFTESSLIPSNGIQNLFQYIQDTPKDTLAWFIIFDLEGGAVRVFLCSLIIDLHMRKTNDVPQNATAYARRDTLVRRSAMALVFLAHGYHSSTYSPTLWDWVHCPTLHVRSCPALIRYVYFDVALFPR